MLATGVLRRTVAAASRLTSTVTRIGSPTGQRSRRTSGLDHDASRSAIQVSVSIWRGRRIGNLVVVLVS